MTAGAPARRNITGLRILRLTLGSLASALVPAAALGTALLARPSAAAAVGLLAVPAAAAVAAVCLPWPLGSLRFRTAGAAAAVLSLAADLLYRGPLPVCSLFLTIELPALCAIAALAVRREPPRPAVQLASAAGVAAVILPVRLAVSAGHLRLAPVLLLVSAALLLLTGTVGGALYLRMRGHRHAEAVRQARRSQRLAIARDLHDFVAHEVTGIVLEAQAARAGGDGPSADRALLERIEDAGQRALASMGEMVGALSDAAAVPAESTSARPRRLADLPALAARFSATGGVRAIVEVAPDLGFVPFDLQELMCRVVVEALTNVRRHAGAARTAVIAVEPISSSAVGACVTDDGGGSSPARQHPHGGTGLICLAQHAEAAGGHLTATETGEGWRVAVVLPRPAGRV
ncbi:MAG: hypothetical protein QOJ50_3443 [Cryptosporangiaceae bacterium]|nr:hypothetical protein [Cryptosporangiaceae bacterium]